MLAPRESPVKLDSSCWLVRALVDHPLFPVPCSCSSIDVSWRHLFNKLLSSNPYFRACFWETLIRKHVLCVSPSTLSPWRARLGLISCGSSGWAPAHQERGNDSLMKRLWRLGRSKLWPAHGVSCQKEDAGLSSQGGGKKGYYWNHRKRRTPRRERQGEVESLVVWRPAWEDTNGCYKKSSWGRWSWGCSMEKKGKIYSRKKKKKVNSEAWRICHHLGMTIPPSVPDRSHLTISASWGFSSPVAPRALCPGHLPVHQYPFLVNQCLSWGPRPPAGPR